MGQEIQQTSALRDIFDIRTANESLQSKDKHSPPGELFGEFWHEGSLAIMFGEPGSGRSALAMQIADSIARGRAIKPSDAPTKPRKVLLLDLGGSDSEFRRRYANGSKQFRFSERLSRVSMRDPEALQKNFSEHLETLIHETAATVLVIDSISSLIRTAAAGREMIELMRHLERLKTRTNVYILLVAGRAGRLSKNCRITDLQDWRILANFADSIFAIGRCGRDASERYLKQVKSRRTVPDAEQVPVFRMRKIDKLFLGFGFLDFANEPDLGRPYSGEYSPEFIDKLKQMSDKGMTIRAIADDVGMARSTVHRILRRVAATHRSPQHIHHDQEPDSIYSRDDDEARQLRREAYLAEAAVARKKNGGNELTAEESAELNRCFGSNGDAVEGSAAIEDPPSPFPGTTPRLNAYGKTIYVESEDNLGRPALWYFIHSDGRRMRAVRKFHGIFMDCVDNSLAGEASAAEKITK